MGREIRPMMEGSILDKRYAIQEVLGEGGSSIAYLAVDLRIGKRVAVKEFLDSSYMQRTPGGQVTAARPEDRDRQEKEEEAFLAEARILAGLSALPGLVDVTDYFEENGTAYIVMQLVPSDLRKYLERNGKLPAEGLLRRMRPLMRTLESLHGQGILHRDISPENIGIKRKGDGRASILSTPLEELEFILMDFGSAGDPGRTGDRLRVKHGYAALEQYEKDAPQGPWTDVYGLCATMYTCMTGITPPSAVLRGMYDELRRLSDLGIPLRGGIEDLLMKGMAVHPEDRFQSAAELEAAVDMLFSEGGAGEKEGKKRKGRRAAAIGAAALALGIGGFAFCWSHREQIYFGNARTEELYLYPGEGMDLESFFSAADSVRERVKVFSGGKYIWEERRDVIRVLFPYACLGGGDEGETIEYYLISPWEMHILYGIGDSFFRIGVASGELESGELVRESSEGQDGTEQEKSYLHVTAREDRSDFMDGFFEKGYGGMLKDSDAYTGWEDEDYPSSFSLEHIQDGHFDILIPEKQENLQEQFLHNILSDPLEQPLNYVCGTEVVFEEDRGAFASCQVAEEDVEGESVLLLYKAPAFPPADLTDGDILDIRREMKERLDLIGRPYAFGHAERSSQVLAVSMAKGEISGLQASVLAGMEGWRIYWAGGEIGTYSGEFQADDGGKLLYVSGHQKDWPQDGTRVFLENGEETLAAGQREGEALRFDTFYYGDASLENGIDAATVRIMNEANGDTTSKRLALCRVSYFDARGKLLPDQRKDWMENTVRTEKLRDLLQAAGRRDAEIRSANPAKVSFRFEGLEESRFISLAGEYLSELLEAAPEDGYLKTLQLKFVSEGASSISLNLYLGGREAGTGRCSFLLSEAQEEEARREMVESGLLDAFQMEYGWARLPA